MGDFEIHAFDLDQISPFREHSSAVVVKNTFLDVTAQLSDGSMPPELPALRRAKTAPMLNSSRASTVDNLTPRSVGSDSASDQCTMFGGVPHFCNSPLSVSADDPAESVEDANILGSQMSLGDCSSSTRACPSPQIRGSSLLPQIHAASYSPHAQENYPLPEGVQWGLRSRGTFLEFFWESEAAQERGLRRISSAPELAATPRLDGVELPLLKSAVSSRKMLPREALAVGAAERRQAAASPSCSSLGDSPASWYPSPRAADPFGGGSNYSFYIPASELLGEAAAVASWQAQVPYESRFDGEQFSEQQVRGVDELGVVSATADDGGWRYRRKVVAPSPCSSFEELSCQKKSGSRLETMAYEVLAQAQQAALEGRSSKVWEWSCRDRYSSLVVQECIEIMAAEFHEAESQRDWMRYDNAHVLTQALLIDLHGHVVDALEHPHANHVVKVAVKKLPTENIGFVAKELSGTGTWAATHSYGCRTVLRLVAHSKADGWAGECVNKYIDEVLTWVEDLCTDEFAKYVIQEFLEHGLPEHRLQIMKALRKWLVPYAMNKFASGLIERALRTCNADLAAEMVRELLCSRDAVCSLIRNQFGMYVLKYVASNPKHKATVRRSLQPLARELQRNRAGKKVLEILSSPDDVPQ